MNIKTLEKKIKKFQANHFKYLRFRKNSLNLGLRLPIDFFETIIIFTSISGKSLLPFR